MITRTYGRMSCWLYLRRSEERDRGASLVEYALLVALIALVCVAAVDILGGETADSVSQSGSRVAAAN